MVAALDIAVELVQLADCPLEILLVDLVVGGWGHKTNFDG
jgi:hypothetical protein